MPPASLQSGLLDAWGFFVHLGVVLVPLFIGGTFLIGLVQEYLPPARVERTLRAYDGGAGNVVAAGVGAVTPFCSCSTVPVLAGLLQAGAPLGLAFSFLLASPLVNEIAVILLVGLFGIRIALMYVAATLAAAIAGGILIGRIGSPAAVKDVSVVAETGDTAVTDGGTSDGCRSADCCTSATASPRRGHRQRLRRALRVAWSFFRETLPYLLLGMTIGALVHGVVPRSWLLGVLGPGNPLAVPVAAVAGAPVYVSMSGMLPIAASLADRGIAVGTVLAFVIGGAGVSLPNLVLLAKLFERRLLILYAVTVVTIGVIIGTLFNTLAV